MSRQVQTDFDVPASLKAPVEGALHWVNDAQAKNYELTGLVDVDSALQTKDGEAFELGLVLCDGEICTCERVRIQPDGTAFAFSSAEAERPAVPPLLDPPEGLRKEWLDKQLQAHEFLLLLFYRGRW